MTSIVRLHQELVTEGTSIRTGWTGHPFSVRSNGSGQCVIFQNLTEWSPRRAWCRKFSGMCPLILPMVVLMVLTAEAFLEVADRKTAGKWMAVKIASGKNHTFTVWPTWHVHGSATVTPAHLQCGSQACQCHHPLRYILCHPDMRRLGMRKLQNLECGLNA